MKPLIFINAVNGDPFFANVSLLLRGDGANGSRSIIDSSPSPKIVTVVGNAQISTAQAKFGGASIAFDGSGDYLTLTDSGNGFAFGIGDFTLEWWFRSTSTTPFASMMTRFYNDPGGISFMLNGDSGNGRPEIYWREYSSALFIQSSIGGFNDGAWHHYAFVRSGTTCYMFIDGVNCGVRIGVSTSVPSSTIYIGSDRQFLGRDYTGNIDNLRITKGVARYTSAFTPPGGF